MSQKSNLSVSGAVSVVEDPKPLSKSITVTVEEEEDFSSSCDFSINFDLKAESNYVNYALITKN
ncbi:hypothetical protein NQ314_015581 [Rhamnusium bicolor]|uniref:Uncharacterized protein n=1 Tax=Rhamnusium bicolor TaxID=1586634 RepID=A0AAV8WXR5_9CUCU|nr:hypothetical protein NQ314_015581 [Rhamnusium bicolor]